MEELIIHKFKGVYNHDINRLGHYTINITRQSTNDAIYLVFTEPTLVKINQGGTVREETISTFSNNFGNYPVGSYLDISNKYNLSTVSLQGETADNVELLAYSTLNTFAFRSVNVSGKLSVALKNSNDLGTFRVYDTNITGNVYDLNGKISNCTIIEMRYCKLTGSMDTIIDQLPDNASVDIRDSAGITISQAKYNSSIARGVTIQAQQSQIIS